jgi:hypothetical protein
VAVGTADARAVLAVLDLVPDEGVLRDVSPVRIQGDALVKARPAGQALGLGAPALFGIIQRLTARLAQLEPRLEAGEEAAWSAYVETVGALALLLPSARARAARRAAHDVGDGGTARGGAEDAAPA